MFTKERLEIASTLQRLGSIILLSGSDPELVDQLPSIKPIEGVLSSLHDNILIPYLSPEFMSNYLTYVRKELNDDFDNVLDELYALIILTTGETTTFTALLEEAMMSFSLWHVSGLLLTKSIKQSEVEVDLEQFVSTLTPVVGLFSVLSIVPSFVDMKYFVNEQLDSINSNWSNIDYKIRRDWFAFLYQRVPMSYVNWSDSHPQLVSIATSRWQTLGKVCNDLEDCFLLPLKSDGDISTFSVKIRNLFTPSITIDRTNRFPETLMVSVVNPAVHSSLTNLIAYCDMVSRTTNDNANYMKLVNDIRFELKILRHNIRFCPYVMDRERFEEIFRLVWQPTSD